MFHPPRSHLREQSKFVRMGGGRSGVTEGGVIGGVNSRIDERMGAVVGVIGPFQLAIHVVQNRRAGEQTSHWDKTNKENYVSLLFVLSQ